MKQDQYNTETLEQQKSNSWTAMGPTKDRLSSPNQLRGLKFLDRGHNYVWGPTAGMQLKMAAKLVTVIGLTTKHTVCRMIFLLYQVIL